MHLYINIISKYNIKFFFKQKMLKGIVNIII